MIDETDSAAIRKSILERKTAYWSAKGVKIENHVYTFVCAYCKFHGGTLVKTGDLMVCEDKKNCAKRRNELSLVDQEFLARMRGELEQEEEG